MTTVPERLICLSEDRPGAEVHLELLLLSLEQFEPGSRVVLHHPNPTDEVRNWPARFPFLHLVEEVPGGAVGWDCKPHVLLQHLEAGAQEVIWLDSDILLLRPLASLLTGLAGNTFVIAQEPRRANHGEYSAHSRTIAWGLEVGRRIPSTLNSCFLRATAEHLSLLRQWRELMADERYRREALLPRSQRADYFYGDQDPLNALLAAKTSSHIPVRMLATGRDVIQSSGPMGFTLRDRWRCASGPGPWAVHAIDVKPWALLRPGQEADGARLLRLFAETSPYAFAARRYHPKASRSRSDWMKRRSLLGSIINLASLGRLSLQGGLLTLAATPVAAVWRPVRPVFRAQERSGLRA